MKVKLTNKEIIAILNNSNFITSRPLPIKASYAISKNINKLNKEIEVYESERMKLINKYAEKDDAGELIIEDGKYKINNINEFNKESNELLSFENELEIHMIDIEVLENEIFTPSELDAITFMFD